MKLIRLVVFSAAVAAVSVVFAAKPINIGLYTDTGSRGGAVARWAELLNATKDVKLTFFSGEMLRNGELKSMDALVMPGGSGIDQYASMQEKGAQAIRDFVRDGGKYFGTCAGIALLLNETNRVALIPFRRINGHYMRGGGDLKVEFTDDAVKQFSLPKKEWSITFQHGPILVPAAPVEGTTAKAIGFCKNGIDDKNRFPKHVNDMIDTPAFVYADCGKGKIFACNCHPEYREENREIIRRGMAYLLGRPFEIPELKPPHVIPCGTVRNVRDLGGWKGLDGKTIKMGQLYRTACFNGITKESYKVGEDGKTNKVYEAGASLINDANRNFMLKGLRIKTEVDLRNGPETRCMTGSPLGDSVKWEHHMIKSYALPLPKDGKEPELKKALDVVMNEKCRPAAFHCALGKDRTGTVAMLVLGVLGVSEDDIRADYVITHKGLTPVKLQKAIDKLKADYAAPTFAENCEKYMLALGIKPEQIAAFRDSMLENK